MKGEEKFSKVLSTYMRIWKYTWNVQNGLDSLGRWGCGWDPTITLSPTNPAHSKGQAASLRSGWGDSWTVHLCESGGNSTGTHVECDSPLSPVHSSTLIEDPRGPRHAAVNKTDQGSVLGLTKGLSWVWPRVSPTNLRANKGERWWTK